MLSFHMSLDIVFARGTLRLLEGELAAGMPTIEQPQISLAKFIPVFVAVVSIQVVI